MIDDQVLLGLMARVVDRSRTGASDKGVSTHLVVLEGEVVDCRKGSDKLSVFIEGKRSGNVNIDNQGVNIYNNDQILEILIDTEVPGAISWESAAKFAARATAQVS